MTFKVGDVVTHKRIPNRVYRILKPFISLAHMGGENAWFLVDKDTGTNAGWSYEIDLTLVKRKELKVI